MFKLANRKRINEYLDECENNSQKSTLNLNYCLILIDIDDFKAINDQHGHDIGDKVLVHFSAILDRLTRRSDLVARWGGEEFIIICPQTSIRGARGLAEGLRLTLSSHEFGEAGRVTSSFGVAEYNPGEPISGMLKRADMALYQAKQEGRNRVVLAEDD